MMDDYLKRREELMAEIAVSEGKLMRCPSCNKPISPSATKCVHCGAQGWILTSTKIRKSLNQQPAKASVKTPEKPIPQKPLPPTPAKDTALGLLLICAVLTIVVRTCAGGCSGPGNEQALKDQIERDKASQIEYFRENYDNMTEAERRKMRDQIEPSYMH